jgi:hypothetical protein
LEEMKRSMATRNFDPIDDALRTKIKPFLYNNGQGRKVSAIEMVLLRNKERHPSKHVSCAHSELPWELPSELHCLGDAWELPSELPWELPCPRSWQLFFGSLITFLN